MNRWRHKKRGTVYDVLTHRAGLQCSAEPEFDMKYDDGGWTVYRKVDSDVFWVSPTDEFLDGRFERVPDGE